jgi:uncharacterized protein (PEP-CTERM system associated)
MPAGGAINNSYLISRPFLNKKDEASVAVLGVRNTIAVTASLNEQRVFGGAGDTTLVFSDVRQKAVSASWAYKVTPFSTLTLVSSRLQTLGLSGLPQESNQYLQSLFLVSQVGSRTSLSLGGRRTKFDSSVAANYRENALVCTASLRF